MTHVLHSANAIDRTKHERETRWPFLMLCFFLLSQAYTIPIIIKGPWPVWLNFCDLSIMGMAITSLFTWRHLGLRSSANTQIARWLMLIYVGCFLSYLFFTISPITPHLDSGEEQAGRISLGAFLLLRLGEMFLVYWLTVRIPLTEIRQRILQRLSLFVFLVVCAGVIVTYFHIIPAEVFIRHLPQTEHALGPWTDFGGSDGLGTIGYNHGYVALQVMALFALTLHFLPDGKRWLISALMVLSLVTVLLTGSRAGLVANTFCVACLMFRQPRYLAISFCLIAILVLALPSKYYERLLPALQRSETISSSYSSDGMSGRSNVWQNTVIFLHEHPFLIITGAGFGYANGLDAHNNYLQYVFEFGIIGLIVFCLIMGGILRYLKRYEGGVQPLFWMTIAYLISALTQETFYPVAAFGHFIALYLASIAITLSTPDNSRNHQSGYHLYTEEYCGRYHHP